MSLSNGFHKFLDAIGIVSRDDQSADERDVPRRGDFDERDDGERGDYEPPRVTRYERTSVQDTYKGYPRTAPQTTPEVDNMVEFKNIRQQTAAEASSDRMQHTVIHYLREISDCKDIIDDLLDDKQVVLNIEDTDDDLKQRAIDMIYGASYALGAKLRRASRATYIIAPSSVVINDTEESEDRRSPANYASNIRGFRS